MKLYFCLEYLTNWGESVHAIITFLSTDGHKSVSDLTLQTTDGKFWESEYIVQESRHRFSYITYYYTIVGSDGSVLRKEWNQPPRVYGVNATKNYYFPDFWRDIPLRYRLLPTDMKPIVDNDVASYATQHLVLNDSSVTFDFTTIFRISMFGLKKGYSIAVCGNNPVLGSWNHNRYMLMNKLSEHEWILSVNLFELREPLQYKYVLVDDESHEIAEWETGENRQVPEGEHFKGDVLVLYGGEARFRHCKAVTKITLETDAPELIANALIDNHVHVTKIDYANKPFINYASYKCSFDTYIFDLDGTLLSTLEDLHASCNYALTSNGMPPRSMLEVRMMVGNGVKNLMRRATPDGERNPKFEKIYADFRGHYMEHNLDKTKPYPGVMQMLEILRRRGKNVAVVSNKFYAATQELCRHFFGNLVQVAIGERENIRMKPAPDTVLEALRQLDVSKKNAVYIGDSDTDIDTARNSELPCISVLWGFRDRRFLKQHGATTFCEEPMQLLDI